MSRGENAQIPYRPTADSAQPRGLLTATDGAEEASITSGLRQRTAN